jgi:AcrR family transcriptional regulator
MHDKKMQLILSAIELFGEHDYHTTTVQDIVSLAGVSKGAFYQHFESKEELLFFIFKYYFDRILSELQDLNRQKHLSPKEMIVRGIKHQCSLLLENKNFLSMIVKGATSGEKMINEMVFQQSMIILHWFQEHITQLYGPEIEPHSVDCSIMLDGCMKNYFVIQIICDLSIDADQLAEYLFERLDDWVYGIKRKQSFPVLNSGFIQKYTSQNVEQLFDNMINNVRIQIETQIADEALKETMQQALHALINEIKKEQSNPVIVQGMYSYLLSLSKQHKSLVDELAQGFDPYIKKGPVTERF